MHLSDENDNGKASFSTQVLCINFAHQGKHYLVSVRKDKDNFIFLLSWQLPRHASCHFVTYLGPSLLKLHGMVKQWCDTKGSNKYIVGLPAFLAKSFDHDV